MAKTTTRSIQNTGGFTLIELMVVIVIIGIVINFAVVSFGSNSPADRLNKESTRLMSLIQIAGEEALLRSSFIGVDILRDSYGFLRLEEGEWQPVDDDLFRDRSLPDDMLLTIITSQPQENSDDEDEKRTPEIILLNSGEMTPFDIKITSINIDDYYRLSGNEVGDLTLNRVSPY
ncbi:MAG: type II secretion system minor pseudopilin GspH [Candidatus Thiodiazotropha sp. (ex Myrtea spinifera)]|nr:type II secretion system minor pseudopilin GspH [Candidatus Thiodiazotropha sp. (ex Myrtea spinifera)]MCU7830521.1 type II secretion system minor pseudopilin GspH [Candidatus Thiodiazotropha sp. (ex Myrtea sp. 'scaly one' KF741663)]